MCAPGPAAGETDEDAAAGALWPRVNVVYSSDARGLTLTVASLQSALRAARRPERLTFNVVLPRAPEAGDGDGPPAWLTGVCGRLLRRSGAAPPLYCSVRSRLPTCGRPAAAPPGAPCACAGNDRFRLISFTDAMLAEAAAIGCLAAAGAAVQAVPVALRPELLGVANFARNHLHEAAAAHPELMLARVVYLDIDTIVVRDVAELYDRGAALIERGGDATVMAAVRRCDRRMEYFFNFESEAVRGSVRADDCYVNAGVYVMDLDRYVRLGMPGRIAALQAAHAGGAGLWREGAHQPSFVLALHNHTATRGIDERWNTSGLGWNTSKTQRELADAYILHWSDDRKPDARGGLYKEVWHALQRVSGGPS